MSIKNFAVGLCGLLIAIAQLARSADPVLPTDRTEDIPLVGIQVTKSLPIRVVDPAGQPIRDAVVKPWALRCSQGHGWWDGDDDRSEMYPRPVTTDADGMAAIAYPYFRNVSEGTRTLAVSLFIDHFEFAFPDAIHVSSRRPTRQMVHLCQVHSPRG